MPQLMTGHDKDDDDDNDNDDGDDDDYDDDNDDDDNDDDDEDADDQFLCSGLAADPTKGKKVVKFSRLMKKRLQSHF